MFETQAEEVFNSNLEHQI